MDGQQLRNWNLIQNEKCIKRNLEFIRDIYVANAGIRKEIRFDCKVTKIRWWVVLDSNQRPID
tara:strand:- start:2 stop:190 length:189 start_codon:yes stop_codon:yes gene_type:complete